MHYVMDTAECCYLTEQLVVQGIKNLRFYAQVVEELLNLAQFLKNCLKFNQQKIV